MNNRRIEQLLYHVSHDLAAPIRQVNSFAQLFADSFVSDDETQTLYLEYVLKQGQLAQDMLAALLELTRITPAVCVLAPTNLQGLVLQVTRLYPDLKVTVEVDEDLEVLADTRLLARLLQCLLANVEQHSGAGEARLSVEPSTAKRVTLLVADDGAGLTIDQWDKFLLPFARAKGHPDETGLGMGLTLADRIAEVHGGVLQPRWDAAGMCLMMDLAVAAPH